MPRLPQQRPGQSAAAPVVVVVDARAQQLVEEARTMVVGGQLPQAQAKLDEVRAPPPGGAGPLVGHRHA